MSHSRDVILTLKSGGDLFHGIQVGGIDAVQHGWLAHFIVSVEGLPVAFQGAGNAAEVEEDQWLVIHKHPLWSLGQPVAANVPRGQVEAGMGQGHHAIMPGCPAVQISLVHETLAFHAAVAPVKALGLPVTEHGETLRVMLPKSESGVVQAVDGEVFCARAEAMWTDDYGGLR
ncbi:hypothetical protein [Verrucomicrobium spinosum]|uniref:hypothetical protein n=1 Tax=Verrucomicrobium spinosum TaxID=2736 RepID=UPI0012E2D5F0|nr:hypothetical protein [Verrucomicrobium spinosum]